MKKLSILLVGCALPLFAGCDRKDESKQDASPTPVAAAAMDESGSFAGQPYTAALLSDEGTKLIRYFKVGHIGVVQGDIDIGDHAALQAETAKNLSLLAGTLDAQALGLTPAEFDAMKSGFPSGLTESEPNKRLFGLGVGESRLWPNRTLIYELGASLTDPTIKQRLTDAIAIWNGTGLVTLRQKKAGDTGRVLVIHSSSELDLDPKDFYCSSSAGYVSEPRMYLSNVCGKYSVVHELGHALGLQHEHGREDRGTLITPDMTKIKKDYQGQYDAFSSRYWNTSHDLCSMMHYSASAPKSATTTGKSELWYTLTEAGTKAFNTCAPTLRNQGECGPTAPTKPGQRCAISQTDRATIRAMYPET